MAKRCNPKELISGLLDEQLFPRASNNPIQIPEVFSSRGLADFACANKNLFDGKGINGGYGSFGYIPCRTYRFDNVERRFGIPHPQGYCALVYGLADNWQDDTIQKLTTSPSSLFKAERRTDRRIYVMHYGGQKRLEDKGQALASLVVRADVKSCFPSIYTHSIERIIKQHNDTQIGKKIGSKLDTLTRKIKKSETNGIIIGPGATNIIAELILSHVDIQMKQAYEKKAKGMLGERVPAKINMMRAVDDYVFFCESHDEAQLILDTLSEQLRLVGLELNHGKTRIDEAPVGARESWLFDIYSACEQATSVRGLSRTCDKLLDIAARFPNLNILNYAYRILVDKIFEKPQTADKDLMISVLELNLIKISRRYPAHLALLDLVYQPGSVPASNRELRENFLKDMFERGYRRGISSTMTWALYLAARLGIKIETTKEHWSDLLGLKDAVTLTMIYYNLVVHKRGTSSFTRFIKDRMTSAKEVYDIDDIWLLHYQMYYEGSISSAELGNFELTHPSTTRRFTQEFWEGMHEANLSFVKVDLPESKAQGRLVPQTDILIL